MKVPRRSTECLRANSSNNHTQTDRKSEVKIRSLLDLANYKSEVIEARKEDTAIELGVPEFKVLASVLREKYIMKQ